VKTKRKGGEWLIKLIDFKNIIDLFKATILPYYYQFNHFIPLIENTTPLFKRLYPLLKVKLKTL